MSTNAHRTSVDLSNDHEMVLTRLLDAPRDLVWSCWSDPEHLAAWWGPANMRNEVEQDFRPGGFQDITMFGPDGVEIPIHVVLDDMVEGEWFSARFGGDDHPQSEVISSIRMTVSLKDAPGGKTLMTITQRFPSKDMRDANMKMGAEAGWSESFVKLDAVLTAL
jgi:uncharacterized protein YndB with AHSA1/START domain